MATDQLSRLVERAMNDPAFISRAQADLDGTLAAEDISLDSDEMAAVREFHSQIVGLSEEEIQGRLSESNRQQGPM
ncbi:MAG TPA: hypothetical protein VGR22_00740 [Thermomicrobiales bacterium]|nr:hypothetical protein [Thermomicrobiales bacterium]